MGWRGGGQGRLQGGCRRGQLAVGESERERLWEFESVGDGLGGGIDLGRGVVAAGGVHVGRLIRFLDHWDASNGGGTTTAGLQGQQELEDVEEGWSRGKGRAEKATGREEQRETETHTARVT